MQTAAQTVAYATINSLNASIGDIRDKLALRESVRKRENARSVTDLEAEVTDPEASIQIDTSSAPRRKPRSSASKGGGLDGQGNFLRKRDAKAQEKAEKKRHDRGDSV